jgi:hypothetical protein
VALFIVTMFLGCAVVKNVDTESCLLTFERSEQQGLLNLVQVHLLVDGKISGDLSGGGKLKFKVSAGRHSVKVASLDPYAADHSQAWDMVSNVIDLSLRPGERKIISIDHQNIDGRNVWIVNAK